MKKFFALLLVFSIIFTAFSESEKVSMNKKHLQANNLAKQGKYNQAIEIFKSLEDKNLLNENGILDYSRALLLSGAYDECKKIASKNESDESAYIYALASFNQENWQEAKKKFSKLAESKSLDKKYVAYSEFYLGYCNYQLAEYENSIKILSRFVEENPVHYLNSSANILIARSATFVNDEKKAITASKNALISARNENEKQEAVLLQAGILTEAKKYDEALSLLSPYISKRTEFGYECKYRTAEILVQKGKTKEADKYFSQLSSYSDKKALLISEESAYRRAELAYSEKDFSKACILFDEYLKKWGNGRFKFAAIYFSAECLAKTGDTEKAILRYEQIVDSESANSYREAAKKNLAELKKSENIDGNTAERQSLDEKIKLAEKNLEVQKNDASKSGESMKNAIFLAESYRTKGENKKSAEMFIEAAKFSRQAGNDENAARSFYGALEGFDAAGLYADAKATFSEMKKLYPKSKYTKNAEKIIKNY